MYKQMGSGDGSSCAWQPSGSKQRASLDEGGEVFEMTETAFTLKTGLAEMLKGGVSMDVTTVEQAKMAEDAGATAVMALERVPADIRAQDGVARMADPTKMKDIMQAVSIPVMAKVRIGHVAEAQI
jgi:pyridoxal 5'-phosphate synthase pdxS subunit